MYPGSLNLNLKPTKEKSHLVVFSLLRANIIISGVRRGFFYLKDKFTNSRFDLSAVYTIRIFCMVSLNKLQLLVLVTFFPQSYHQCPS